MAYPLQPMTITSATLTLNEENHGNGAIVRASRAAGFTYTLPTSVGAGAKFRIYVLTTLAGSGIIKVANSTDVIFGIVQTHINAAAVGATWSEIATGTDDTITMNGTTAGGIAGSYIELDDVAAGFWKVEADLLGSGTLISTLSATV